jgi:hypothetical protein
MALSFSFAVKGSSINTNILEEAVTLMPQANAVNVFCQTADLLTAGLVSNIQTYGYVTTGEIKTAKNNKKYMTFSRKPITMIPAKV